MKEVWVPIKGFENAYEISNQGRVKSLERTIQGKDGVSYKRKGKILVGSMTGNYRGITLCLNGYQERFYIHRLVATHFHGDPKGGRSHVNHKDGDRFNNRTDNLEWVTPGENNRHAYHNGLNENLTGENSHFCKYPDEVIQEIRDLYDNGIYKQYELAALYGMSRMQVSRVVRRILRVGGKQHESF